MPQVGKDKTTLELQKQRYLEDLEQKTKNRAYFKKAKTHLKDTGSSLIQGKDTKSTLENLLDASKRDENIEKLAVKDLGATPGQVKPFIQSLDDTLKEFLLNRFEGFKKVFKDNFTIPSSQNLKAAFEIFNRQQIEKLKDIDVPTPAIVRDYLLTLDQGTLQRIGLRILDAIDRFNARRKQDFLTDMNAVPTQEEKVDVLMRLISNFIRQAPSEIEGFTALAIIFDTLGLRDAPRPKLVKTRDGTPSSTINAPISSTPTPQGQRIMGVERFKALSQLSVADLRDIARAYRDFYNAKTEAQRQQENLRPRITSISNKTKEQLVRALIIRGYDTRNNTFDIAQISPLDAYVPETEPLGDNQITTLINHMDTNYDDIYNNPTLKAGVNPNISNIEGFGMMKIYKLRK
jgi:hypothetical protein